MKSAAAPQLLAETLLEPVYRDAYYRVEQAIQAHLPAATLAEALREGQALTIAAASAAMLA